MIVHLKLLTNTIQFRLHNSSPSASHNAHIRYEGDNSSNGAHLLGDLCRQMHQKKRREQLQRGQDNVSIRRHFQTLDSLWGRPGHGAPRANKNKLNLDALLYKMPMQIVDKEL